MAEIKQLNPELIRRANSNSFGGKRGDISANGYENYANKILSWDISETKKQRILNKLYEKWSKMLEHEAKHVSVMVAGASNYNTNLDHSDTILRLSSEFTAWFKNLEEEVEQGKRKNNKVARLVNLIEFETKPGNDYDPKEELVKLANYDRDLFVEYYDKLYPKYKWRKNSNVAKLYATAKDGTLRVIKKEVFYENDDFTAYTEGDRVYIKFAMKPQRQLIVALKSRGYWWNSRENAWSTYLQKLDKEWVSSISQRYEKYI